MLAAMLLGGPWAAMIVTFLGTTDDRELRGQIPWYGTLYNHCGAAAAIGIAGATYEWLLPLGADSLALEFVAAMVASAVFLALSWSLAVFAVVARTGVSMRSVWAQDIGAVAIPLLGLVPLAWLMAQIFQLPNGAGWWATTLFVVPLLTTRVAYARYVETSGAL